AVTSEQVFAVFVQGHVYVHARTVVTHDRLGHEGGGFAVGVGYVVHAVLQNLNFVCLAGQGVRANADFTLAGRAHFVVVHFDGQTHAFHGRTHSATQVVQAVYRRNREVAAFHARAVAEAVTVEACTVYPVGCVGVELVHGALHVGPPVNGIKDEELRLRAEQGAVGNACRLQVFLCALGNGAGVPFVTRHGCRF